MKEEKRKSVGLKVFWVAFLSIFIFAVCCAVTLLSFSKEPPSTAADKNVSNVPYQKTPENKNVYLIFEDSDAVIINLDFDKQKINAAYIDEFSEKQNSYYGYNCDYTLHLDYKSVCDIIDRFGGVTFQTQEGLMRYTGIQAVEALHASENKREIKKQIILQIFEQINKKGFSNDDFSSIIKRSETNLSMIDCFKWLEYLPDMANRINFVN